MRFHLDEHIDTAIATGLRRRGIDVTTTGEAGLEAASDSVHIDFGRRENRVIVRNDTDFLALSRFGIAHNGVVYCNRQLRTIGEIIEFLVLINACLASAEMLNHIEFI